MKLPKTIYARVEEEEGHEPYLVAVASVVDAVDGDGPSDVGVYRLSETMEVKKTVAISKYKKIKAVRP